MKRKYAGRAGEKLEHALHAFRLAVTDKVCADFGCAVGGFTDCLLAHGAKRVYAVDTAYGTLDWRLRNDPRVVVMERTNAMHVSLPEPVDLIAVDTGWTKQERVIPQAMANLKPDGAVISLLKPHYECGPDERERGTVKPDRVQAVVDKAIAQLTELGYPVSETTESPLVGSKGANREFLILLPFAVSNR